MSVFTNKLSGKDSLTLAAIVLSIGTAVATGWCISRVREVENKLAHQNRLEVAEEKGYQAFQDLGAGSPAKGTQVVGKVIFARSFDTIPLVTFSTEPDPELAKSIVITNVRPDGFEYDIHKSNFVLGKVIWKARGLKVSSPAGSTP